MIFHALLKFALLLVVFYVPLVSLNRSAFSLITQAKKSLSSSEREADLSTFIVFGRTGLHKQGPHMAAQTGAPQTIKMSDSSTTFSGPWASSWRVATFKT